MQLDAPAKVNIFLKITGLRGAYHELRSRFVRVDTLCDTLQILPGRTRPHIPGLELESSRPLPPVNTLTRAYDLLKAREPAVERFFHEHRLQLTKRIPEGAGLGGGSSDAAAFLRLCNRVCDLGLSPDELARIGKKIGADVPFFVYGYPSANVEGIGERIVPFDETPPPLRLYTPPLHCDTKAVYQTFRQHFARSLDPDAGKAWLALPSRTLLATLDPTRANDLYPAAVIRYPELLAYAPEGAFFSGSGSTFFSPE